MSSIHTAVKACASGSLETFLCHHHSIPWYHQDWVELPSITETFPKATLATFQLRNELKRCCCAGKTPATLKIIEEESRQVPLGGKRGYGFLPITVTISFDILSTLSFSPVLQNSSCDNTEPIFGTACHCTEGDRWGWRKHLLGALSLPRPGGRRWVTTWPGSQGSPPPGSHRLVRSTRS